MLFSLFSQRAPALRVYIHISVKLISEIDIMNKLQTESERST